MSSVLMCLVSQTNGCVSAYEDNKRLVLHSDTDLATEIMTLKAQVLAMNSDLNAKNQDILDLRNNITILKDKVEAKDREMSTIRTNITRQLQEEASKRLAETTAISQSIAHVQKMLTAGMKSCLFFCSTCSLKP